MNIKHLVIVSTLAAVIVGCSTTTSQPNTAQEQLLVTTAAASAVMIDVQSRPQDAPAFRAAGSLLSTLAGSTNQVSVAQVQAVLSAAGETNAYITLLEPLVVNLVDVYTSGNTNVLNGSSSQALQWIATGLTEGAGVPAGARYHYVPKK